MTSVTAAPARSRVKSQQIYERLCQVIPGGVNSPVRAFPGLDEAPMVVESGSGALIRDVDGNEYVDFCSSWGALILGHADPELLKDVQAMAAKGTSFGITTEIEQKLAAKIVSMIPSVDLIRFVSSGTEATMSAVRLARGYTERNLVIKFDGNYHGHGDAFLVSAGSGVTGLGSESSSAGIPHGAVEDTISLPFNDLEALEEFFADEALCEDLAAVILEPIAGNMGVVPADIRFMQKLREETERVGALLIFDEVMTGFRVAKGGAQSLYDVTPDLTCFAKIIGGGFPAAAFGGRRDIMECLAPLGSVYQAGTLSGNPVAMAAGLHVLERIDSDEFYQSLETKTSAFVGKIQASIDAFGVPACVQRAGAMFTLFLGQTLVKNQAEAKACDLEGFKKYFSHMFNHGVYIPPSQFEGWFMMDAHTQDQLDLAASLTHDFLQKWAPKGVVG